MKDAGSSLKSRDETVNVDPDKVYTGTGSPGIWSFWLVGILMLVMVSWAVWMVVKSGPVTPEQRASASFKPKLYSSFDMETCLVPEAEIFSGGPKKDGIPALVDPPVVSGLEVKDINSKMYGKYLVSGDRVLGVEINGESRAYPLSILNLHEIVNDTVGNVPIAVTFCPLCDSAIVFSRQVEGEILEFGVSGLLYNSNVLLFDRRVPEPDGRLPVVESLWSQMQMRAVCGPAASEGHTLDVLASEMSHWDEWFNSHPKTTVLSLETGHERDYKKNPYEQYLHEGKIMFEVEPQPKIDLDPMARVVAVRQAGTWKAYVYNQPGDMTEPQPKAKWEQDGLVFSYQPYRDGMQPPTISVTSIDGNPLAVVYSFWEPWYSMHPEVAEPTILDIPIGS